MDKRALQLYATWAKDNLEKQVEVSLKTIGINSDKGIKESKVVGDYTVIAGDPTSYPKELYSKRQTIIELIKNVGYDATIEEFAYTWFNRFVALRFMEVHDFLPHGFRVLSSRDGSIEPEILKNISFLKDELKLDLSLCETLKGNGIEELYRYVLFRQCKALAGILPMLFEADNDCLELLLPKTLLLGDTVLTKLVALGEEVFLEDVEIIGWLYQFWVASDREQFRKANLVTKELIPTLTQVFTPDWVVRYMAENSVGRLWLESYPESPLRNELKYYVPNPEQTEEVQRKIDAIKYSNVNPEEIKIIEPCCGSGHILVYVFDLLYKMYEEKGYQRRDIPTLILQNNLYGLDIDKRAAQLAAFALVMRARSINNRFFLDNYYVKPQVYEIYDSRALFAMGYKQLLEDTKQFSHEAVDDIEYLADTFRYAKTIGSLIKVKPLDWDRLEQTIDTLENKVVYNVFNMALSAKGISLIKKLVMQAKLLSNQYDVMITNPPYLGISKLDSIAKDYLVHEYPDSKTDMFAMFMEVPFVKKNGFRAIVNPDSWMFLVSYEQLRKKILRNEEIINMVHLGMGGFDATVQTTTFVLRNENFGGNGVYFRLVDSNDKEQAFLSNLTSRGGGGLFEVNAAMFAAIPGNPIAYWLSEKFVQVFQKGFPLGTLADAKQGLATANNNRFIRIWYEVELQKVYFGATDCINAFATGAKWFPYNKGGDFRRWYGNNDYVVNWYENGREIQNYKDNTGKLLSRPQNMQYYFQESGSWSDITTGTNAFRYKPQGHIFDVTGMSFFSDKSLHYLIAFCNTKIVVDLLKILSPTIHCQCGDVAKLPVIVDNGYKVIVDKKAKENIETSKQDWDAFETSWDFKKHPLI